MSTRAGLGGRGPARPDRCFCPGRCSACSGYCGPITALQPVPGAPAPGPALDLTLALPVAGGWAPLPQRRFQTLPHSQHPQARGAAPGHDPPAGPPQNRAGAGSSGLEGEEQWRGSMAVGEWVPAALKHPWTVLSPSQGHCLPLASPHIGIATSQHHHALGLPHPGTVPPATRPGAGVPSANACSTPQPSPHLVPFPMDPHPWGPGTPNLQAGQPLRWQHPLLPCPPPTRTN